MLGLPRFGPGRVGRELQDELAAIVERESAVLLDRQVGGKPAGPQRQPVSSSGANATNARLVQ